MGSVEGATRCYDLVVRTVSQRELRNDNAQVVRAVEAGEAFTVTRRGVPVARLVPVDDDPDVRCLRPAVLPPDFSAVERVKIDESSTDLLDYLRGDR